ncbi:MAG: hypothetical protein K1X75_16520 [Leptospirales bacterium]|nr:hypothetical protein [Leptospirales bacterium]
MKIHLRAFAIAFSSISAAAILIISIWTRVSADFGDAFMDAYNSIHPHPFRATLESLSVGEQAAGATFDLFYAAIDGLIFSLSIALLYNRLAKKSDSDDENG